MKITVQIMEELNIHYLWLIPWILIAIISNLLTGYYYSRKIEFVDYLVSFIFGFMGIFMVMITLSILVMDGIRKITEQKFNNGII